MGLLGRVARGAAEEFDRRLERPARWTPVYRPIVDPWAAEVVPLLGLERREGKLYRPGATRSLGDRELDAAELEAKLGLEPVKVDDPALARFLEEEGRLVRVGNGLAISTAAYERAREKLVDECRAEGGITLARYRDLLGVGRKTAELLLERFDADGITRRTADRRILRRSAREG